MRRWLAVAAVAFAVVLAAGCAEEDGSPGADVTTTTSRAVAPGGY